jgi:hypothetical protein
VIELRRSCACVAAVACSPKLLGGHKEVDRRCEGGVVSDWPSDRLLT